MDIICYKNSEFIINSEEFIDNYKKNYTNSEKNIKIKLFL